MAADRGAYIDQSQSLNIHIAEPNYGKLTSMHFYGWKQVRSSRPLGTVQDAISNMTNEFSYLIAGSKDRNVLSEDKASSESHSVHTQQGEAEGATGGQIL